MKKDIQISSGTLSIENIKMGARSGFKIDFVGGLPIISITEGNKTITYSLDRYDFECMKEFLKGE